MRKKILFGAIALAVVALAVMYLNSVKPRTAEEGAVQLSYNLCLGHEINPQIITLDTMAFTTYRSHQWLDSSRQYFGKAILINASDTLLVSVINGMDFRTASELLLSASGQVLDKKRDQYGPIEVFGIYNQSSDSSWWVRSLVFDKQLGASVLIDHSAANQTEAKEIFTQSNLAKTIKRCI